MNLSEPLEGLMPPVEAAVIRVLSRTDAGMSGRQVHAVAGVGSTSGVHRALTRLVRTGLVRVESRPPALIYRANRAHVLWKAVDSALNARDDAINKIRLFFVDEVPEEVPVDWRVTATLYGSVARRTSTSQSDVDVLVVFPDRFDVEVRADLLLTLAERIEELTGNTAQVNAMDRSEFLARAADGDVFLANVLRDGIHLFGPQPDTWAAA
ncbi:nucleotidyltransferase family protein [Microbacterium enclense]|uniref:nucleotidyltransferase family protein n=2 Tax=Microbacterium enclense TaxID=993073 RepID=UPI003D7606AD